MGAPCRPFWILPNGVISVDNAHPVLLDVLPSYPAGGSTSCTCFQVLANLQASGAAQVVELWAIGVSPTGGDVLLATYGTGQPVNFPMGVNPAIRYLELRAPGPAPLFVFFLFP